jgi:hypothetical protein
MDKTEVTKTRTAERSEHVFEIGAVSEENKGNPPIVHEAGSVGPGPFEG